MKETTKQSAEEIVPFLIKILKPKSIVDLGCGIGIWLREFEKQGVKDIFGIDGPWLKKEMLIIPKNKFINLDINKKISLNRKFDLAISLEVAEHLLPSSAKNIVSSLTELSDVVLFSAAVPFQGGVNHFNEQYQSYWAEKFKRRGYIPLDCIRRKFWNNKKILPHYLQNCFIYVKKSKIKNYGDMTQEEKRLPFPLDIIHPREYERFAIPCKKIKDFLPRFLLNFLRRFEQFRFHKTK